MTEDKEGWISDRDTSPTPQISIVFATRNRLAMLRDTVDSIRRECGKSIPYEIVVVDGLSSDGTGEYLVAQPDVVHVREERLEGCCRAFDKGFRAARGNLVCWLNDDVALSAGCLDKAVQFMNDPGNSDVGIGAFPASTSSTELSTFVLNCCGYPPLPFADMGVIRRSTLEKVDYLNSRYKRFGWDPDLSLKVWAAGQRVAVVPGVEITHYFCDDIMRQTHEFLRDSDSRLLNELWDERRRELAPQVWSAEAVRQAWPYLHQQSKVWLLAYLGRPVEAASEMDGLQGGSELLNVLYEIALGYHRSGEVEEARKLYEVIELRHDLCPRLSGWAHFKHGESLEGDPAREHFLRALDCNPDIAKARLHLVPKAEPLRVVVGDGCLDGFEPLNFDLGNDELWSYYFDRRMADVFAVVGDAAQLDRPVDAVVANALRHLSSGGELLVGLGGATSQEELLPAKVDDIRRYAGIYRREFSYWRDALLVGWLLAKSPAGLNERDVEWPWVLGRAKALEGRGRLLDVGSYATILPGQLHALGYSVTALDLNLPELPDATGIEVVVGDIQGTDGVAESFDVITCVSTLEHIGVSHRYGQETACPDGDVKAMAEMLRLLRPGGRILLTVPCGVKDVLPINRCYNEARLGAIFAGADVVAAEFRVTDSSGVWHTATASEAGATDWLLSPWYALGLFELVKPL